MDNILDLTEQEQHSQEDTAKHSHYSLLQCNIRAILLLTRKRVPVELAEILDNRKEGMSQWRQNCRACVIAGLTEGRRAGRSNRTVSAPITEK